jgi:hypothetical protein
MAVALCDHHQVKERARLPHLAGITLCAAQQSGEDLQALMSEIDRVQRLFTIIIK